METILNTQPIVNQPSYAKIEDILDSGYWIIHMNVWIQQFTQEPRVEDVKKWHATQSMKCRMQALERKAKGGKGGKADVDSLYRMAERHERASTAPKIGQMKANYNSLVWVSLY